MVRESLEMILEISLPESCPSFMKDCSVKYGVDLKFRLDGYCEKEKIAFEYHGEQHFCDVPVFFNKKRTFEDQQQRDILVRDLCNTYQVKLIEVGTISQKSSKVEIINILNSAFEKAMGYPIPEEKIIMLSFPGYE